jgi:hypothetical protein
MNAPGILTAIPKRRYKYGEFSVVVLGEIESSDGIDYQYVLAVLKGSDPAPGLYLTAEKAAGMGAEPDYTMRIIMKDGAEVLARSPVWGELDAFTREGLEIVSDILGLSDEVPYQLP